MRFVLQAVFLTAAVAGVARAETAEEKAFRVAKNGEVVFNNYPPRALKAGEQGMVGFLITIDKDGEPTECRVTHTSGHPQLDQETCALISNHGVFKPVRDANGRLVRVARSEGFVNWQIPGKAPVMVARKIASKDAPDKMVCRRIERTGSLIAKDRICKTSREWTRMQAEQKGYIEQIQGIKGVTNGAPPGGD